MQHFVSHKITKDRDKLENSCLENSHNMTKSIEERKRIWHACVRFVRNQNSGLCTSRTNSCKIGVILFVIYRQNEILYIFWGGGEYFLYIRLVHKRLDYRQSTGGREGQTLWRALLQNLCDGDFSKVGVIADPVRRRKAPSPQSMAFSCSRTHLPFKHI